MAPVVPAAPDSWAGAGACPDGCLPADMRVRAARHPHSLCTCAPARLLGQTGCICSTSAYRQSVASSPSSTVRCCCRSECMSLSQLCCHRCSDTWPAATKLGHSSTWVQERRSCPRLRPLVTRAPAVDAAGKPHLWAATPWRWAAWGNLLRVAATALSPCLAAAHPGKACAHMSLGEEHPAEHSTSQIRAALPAAMPGQHVHSGCAPAKELHRQH